MSISSATGSTALTHQPPPAVKAAPFRRDRDGDYDNNAAESKTSEGAEAGKGGLILNIKA